MARDTPMISLLAFFILLTSCRARSEIDSEYLGLKEPWQTKYGAQVDHPFTGPHAFSHLNYTRCLDDPTRLFDIAILGIPFDTGVTHRPGARFGPFGIRTGSRRHSERRGYTMAWGINPYEQGFNIIDCGDVRNQVLNYVYH